MLTEGGFRLKFQIGSIPVTIHWSFFLLVLIGALGGDLLYALVWALAVSVTLIVHEMAHALMAKYYGQLPAVTLYAMGGLTSFGSLFRMTNQQNILMTAAGPFAGFTLAALLYGFAYFARLSGVMITGFAASLLSMLIYINLVWGVINLVPMLPLDGGQIMRHLWLWLKNPLDERTPLVISLVVGVIVIAICVYLRMTWLLLITLWITFQNFTRLRSFGQIF